VDTISRAIVGYLFMLGIVRVIGRRPGAQMTPFEFVLIFFIGGITIQSIVGDDRSMTNAVCVVMTVSMMHVLVSWLKQKFGWVGRIVDGTPLVLMENGQWRPETMHNMRIQDTDIMAAARGRGLKELSRVKYAILERNGAISVIEVDDDPEDGGEEKQDPAPVLEDSSAGKRQAA
jgi:uncharacterized membrane protein YcaP (DUF421 family)